MRDTERDYRIFPISIQEPKLMEELHDDLKERKMVFGEEYIDGTYPTNSAWMFRYETGSAGIDIQEVKTWYNLYHTGQNRDIVHVVLYGGDSFHVLMSFNEFTAIMQTIHPNISTYVE